MHSLLVAVAAIVFFGFGQANRDQTKRGPTYKLVGLFKRVNEWPANYFPKTMVNIDGYDLPFFEPFPVRHGADVQKETTEFLMELPADSEKQFGNATQCTFKATVTMDNAHGISMISKPMCFGETTPIVIDSNWWKESYGESTNYPQGKFTITLVKITACQYSRDGSYVCKCRPTDHFNYCKCGEGMVTCRADNALNPPLIPFHGDDDGTTYRLLDTQTCEHDTTFERCAGDVKGNGNEVAQAGYVKGDGKVGSQCSDPDSDNNLVICKCFGNEHVLETRCETHSTIAQVTFHDNRKVKTARIDGTYDNGTKCSCNPVEMAEWCNYDEDYDIF